MQSTCRRCGRSTALGELSTDSMGRPICKACKGGQKPAVNPQAASQAALSMIAKSAAATAQAPKKDVSARPAASAAAAGNVGRKAPVVSRPASMPPANTMGRSVQAAAPLKSPSPRPTSGVTNTPGPSQHLTLTAEGDKSGAYKCSKCGYSFKPTRSNPKVYAVCPFCKGPIIR